MNNEKASLALGNLCDGKLISQFHRPYTRSLTIKPCEFVKLSSRGLAGLHMYIVFSVHHISCFSC